MFPVISAAAIVQTVVFNHVYTALEPICVLCAAFTMIYPTTLLIVLITNCDILGCDAHLE